ncbi:hypothetical protein [Rugosimonospora acidiphila]|uniref:hypothetical protein n=1 Tax=Rugosimonospora acidiphila TaxID=556531 RepID=UPI0031EECA2B
MAPPGETFIACVHCETGPSPWLNGLFDEIPFLGLIVALTRRFYFITLTNTTVVVNSANRFTNRPGDVVCSFPRNAFPVQRVKRGRVWSSMYVQLPTGGKPTRLNVNRYWRDEFDSLMTVVPAAIPAQATPAAAPQTPAV